jgi:gas vesicle protein
MTTSNDPDEIRADIERTRATLSDDVDDLAESVKPKSVARRQVDKVKDAVGNVKDRVMGSDDDDYSTSSTVGDRASATKDAVADRAYAAKDAVTDKAYAARDTVSEKASDAADAVREAPATLKRKAQGNPLAAGVIAFGLGMLVSSLIPSSEKERQAVSTLQENLEPVKQKATEVARDVGEGLKPAAQEAADSVKSTAQEGVESVKQEGQSAAQDVKGQAQESKESVRRQRSS